jgi:hypothetical protein
MIDQKASYCLPSSVVLNQFYRTTNPRLENDHFGANDNILHHGDVCNILLLVSQTVRRLKTNNIAMQHHNFAYSKRGLYIPLHQTSVLTKSQAGLRGLSDEYRSTPLDFVNDNEYVMHLIWDYYINLLQRLHIPLFSRRITARPHNRNRGDKFLKTALNFEFFALVVIIPFSATFMCAWKFYFPSETERILWRTASVFFFVFGAVGGSYTWLWHLMLFEKYKQNAWLSRIEASASPLHREKAIPAGSTIPLPKSLIWPVSFLCFFHVLFRTYIFVEDIISLRSLPSSVFTSVNWSLYIPHI